MKKPKAINLFLDMRDEFSLMSEEQVGRLVMALLNYAQDGKQPDFRGDQGLALMFRTLKKQVDRDFAKYDEICRKRSKIGKHGNDIKYGHKTEPSQKLANDRKSSQYEDEDKNENKYENDDDDENKNKNEDERDSAAAEDERASSLRYFMQSSDIQFYLSNQAHTPLRLTDKRSQNLIVKRLKEGYTVDDLKRVINRKCREWSGTQYEKYLRPDILFGEKFESFLRD